MKLSKIAELYSSSIRVSHSSHLTAKVLEDQPDQMYIMMQVISSSTGRHLPTTITILERPQVVDVIEFLQLPD